MKVVQEYSTGLVVWAVPSPTGLTRGPDPRTLFDTSLISGFVNQKYHLLLAFDNLVKIGVRGKDVSIENLHQGFTHVFESTFETVEGIATYISHPVHVEFATVFLDHLEKVLVVDFKPTAVVDP